MSRKHTLMSVALLGVGLVCAAPFMTVAQTELTDPHAGCGAQGRGCNRAALQSALAATQAIAVEARAGDRMAAGQLDQLVTSLGKALAGPDQPAQMTFHLNRINTDGVFVGPGGTALATLVVYGPSPRSPGPGPSGPGPSGAHGPLIWSETYTGQLDLTWPAVMQGLIAQFKTQLTKR